MFVFFAFVLYRTYVWEWVGINNIPGKLILRRTRTHNHVHSWTYIHPLFNCSKRNWFKWYNVTEGNISRNMIQGNLNPSQMCMYPARKGRVYPYLSFPNTPLYPNIQIEGIIYRHLFTYSLVYPFHCESWTSPIKFTYSEMGSKASKTWIKTLELRIKFMSFFYFSL